MQGLINQIEAFGLYLKSNRMPLKCFNLMGDMIRLVFEKITPAALCKTDCGGIRMDTEKPDK